MSVTGVVSDSQCHQPQCELCTTSGGDLLWQNEQCRVVLVDEPGYPGFCRVIWKHHVREMTDLDTETRNGFMNTVFATESAVRQVCTPDKVNLASLGNMTPHLHWHVIPRWREDQHFPAPIWATPRRDNTLATAANLAQQLRQALNQKLGVSA